MGKREKDLFRPRQELLLMESYAAYLLYHAGWEQYKPVCLDCFARTGFVENVVMARWCPANIEFDDVMSAVYMRITDVVHRKMVMPSAGFGGYLNYMKKSCWGAAIDEIKRSDSTGTVLAENIEDPLYWMDESRLIREDILDYVVRVAMGAVRFDGWERDTCERLILGILKGESRDTLRRSQKQLKSALFFRILDYCTVLVAWAKHAYRSI